MERNDYFSNGSAADNCCDYNLIFISRCGAIGRMRFVLPVADQTNRMRVQRKGVSRLEKSETTISQTEAQRTIVIYILS